LLTGWQLLVFWQSGAADNLRAYINPARPSFMPLAAARLRGRTCLVIQVSCRSARCL